MATNNELRQLPADELQPLIDARLKEIGDIPELDDLFGYEEEWVEKYALTFGLIMLKAREAVGQDLAELEKAAGLIDYSAYAMKRAVLQSQADQYVALVNLLWGMRPGSSLEAFTEQPEDSAQIPLPFEPEQPATENLDAPPTL